MDFLARYGPWGLVTGATAGIGREFACALARRGLNVVLVARNQEGLTQFGQQLRTQFGTDIRTISADLSHDSGIEKVIRAAADLEIRFLVNNAGTYAAGAVLSCPWEEVETTARLNILAPLRLAYHFGRKMRDGCRGGIVFLSSTSGYQAVPYLGTYAASKAFVLLLGESMYAENFKSGVDVLVLSPGPTSTPGMENLVGIEFSRLPMSFMTTSEVVELALSQVGRRPSVVAGLRNKLMLLLSQRLMPRYIWLMLTRRTMKNAILPGRL